MRRGRIKVLGAMVLAAGLLTACGGGSSSGSGTLLVYSGQHLQTSAALVAAFERATGITVAVRSADEAVLVNQISTEGARSPADVFLASNSPAIETVAAKGLLTTLPSSILSVVPATDSSTTGKWVGVSARISVLAYNTSSLTRPQLPTSIMGLASPKWRGKLGLAPSESDFQPIVTSVALRYGTAACLAWLEGLKANAGSHIYPSNEALLVAIDRGAVQLGVLNQYYWYRVAERVGVRSMTSAITTFADGDAGYVRAISGAGILASSHHQSEAERFVAFLVSPQGQEIIARSGSYEYPIVPGSPTPLGEPPLSSLAPAPLTIVQLGTGATALELLQKAQLL